MNRGTLKVLEGGSDIQPIDGREVLNKVAPTIAADLPFVPADDPHRVLLEGLVRDWQGRRKLGDRR